MENFVRPDVCLFVCFLGVFLLFLYNSVLGLIWWTTKAIMKILGSYCSRPNKIQWNITEYTFRTRTSDVRIRFIPSIDNARESSIFKDTVQQENLLNVG